MNIIDFGREYDTYLPKTFIKTSGSASMIYAMNAIPLFCKVETDNEAIRNYIKQQGKNTE